jgi:anthranilate/para-aminobenzoate synthase component I
MISIDKALPLPNLSSLNSSQIAIKVNPEGGFFAYLDFFQSHTLDHNDVKSGIDRLTQDFPVTNLSFSGWIGFFGYEFLASHLGLNLEAKRDLNIPDGWFGRPQTIIHLLPNQTKIESSLAQRAAEIGQTLEFSTIHNLNKVEFHTSSQKCNLDFPEYEKIFSQAREAILDGESYQIKISQRHEAKVKVDPLLAFAKLHLANPAPEAFLLQTEEFSLVSCSPEIVIEKKGPHIKTRPIGGTYERNQSENDRSIIERFLNDPKEVAEHNMLVDLERNDLSSVCQAGSVQLTRFREVETYAHLHHLVSTIEGTLNDRINLSEILSAMLPGGSITGCPKIRTMEWIDRLEPCFRGPYTGSFGMIADQGDISLNLIIRSMLILGDNCYTQTGGGIVIDSTPEYEYKENYLKARALLDLLS